MKSLNETIAAAILNSVTSDCGTFSIEIESCDIMILVEGGYEIEDYRDNDYFTGTGGYVTPFAAVCISTLESYNKDGDDVDIDCDVYEIEQYVKDALAA